jgi:hypothetical protein
MSVVGASGTGSRRPGASMPGAADANVELLLGDAATIIPEVAA